MIKINLLPKDLRKSDRKIILPNKLHLFGVVVIFVLLHTLLFATALIKNVQLLSLRKTWSVLEPDSQKYSSTKKQVKGLEASLESAKIFFSRDASFAQLFSSLNSVIPRGLWLERFSLTDKSLLIQGSVVSLTQNEMSMISTFLQGLKDSEVYNSLSSKIELTSVQRRTIKSYDVVDFVLAGDLKK